ncbi:MAG TPA: hypothetical protein VK695_09880 [Steroidobacteraceae bacterium]|jgi:hypothetical protein|nr:hypothetical protein [Steroidobacteraceae bacterium]
MRTLRFTLLLAWCAVPLTVSAQQSSAPAVAPAQIPRPDQLEPAVTTSSAAAASQSTASAGDKAAEDKPASVAAGSKAAAGKAPARKAGADRVELGTTDITGNRELPKVLYIVPWKRSDLGDLTGKPVNSLLDEVLQPLDRDVFRRENRYYDDLKPNQAAPKTGTAQGSVNNP